MKKINFGLLLFILLTGTSCISSKKMIYLQGVDSLANPAQVIQQDYELRIKPDDQLYIMVSSKEPELLAPFANTQILGSSTSGGGTNIQETTGVQVDKNGKIDVPVLGEIQAAGLTRLQLAGEIKKRLEEGLNALGEHPDLENLEEDRILEEIQIVKRDSAGYVETVQIGAETYSGDAVRYALGVPSPAFSLEEDGDEIRCVTYGRGHGYGLSQYGAGLMAENGSSAEEILKHYFKNIQIVSE